MAGEGPIVSGMAGRYATALFELAVETGSIDQIKNDLDAFEALAVGNPDLMRLIRSPVFGADEQAKALGAVLARAGIAGLAAQFLKVVAANRRLFAVRRIIRDFRALVASHKGEVTADGKDVQMNVHIDPSIIGGLIVKLGSRMVDSSLRTKLSAIKHAMKEAG
jgi:F-type H+-transporting ATPase subunit delta